MYSENKSHCKISLFNFIIARIFLIDRDLCMQVDLDPMLRGENSWKESLGRSRLFTAGPTTHHTVVNFADSLDLCDPSDQP